MNAAVVAAVVAVAALAPSTPAPPAPPSVDVTEPRNQAVLVLGGGVGLGVVSATAFVVGLDKERALRATAHDEKAADDLLNERTTAAWVAWPAAVLSAGAVAWGVAWLALLDEARAHGQEPPP